MSETAIVCALASATLASNPRLRWAEWAGDYSLIRSAIVGFHKGVPAWKRIWKTASGKAEFETPSALNATGFSDESGRYRLTTLRSNDQFNTTVYGYHDRFRGVKGTRMIVFMNPRDIEREKLIDGQEIALVGDAPDKFERRVQGLRIVPYNIPEGCLGAYFPECNPLIALDHHAIKSHVPAAKSVPVRILQS